uniref:Uncharacterized protein n=1 Tax=Kalanchoe fedtschenkoi TaxID=63787 RepID=A0A7N0U5S1_KALFE
MASTIKRTSHPSFFSFSMNKEFSSYEACTCHTSHLIPNKQLEKAKALLRCPAPVSVTIFFTPSPNTVNKL